MPGQGPQIALVEDGVGVLLRVDDPDDGIHQRQDPVDLFAVLHGRRVMVGQIHEDEAAQLRLRLRALQRPPPQPSRNPQPVDEARRSVAPTARDRRGRGGPADARLRDRHPRERVEQRRLATAGGARDGDDRVLPREPAPRRRLVQHPPRLREGLAVQPRAGLSHQLAQRVESRPQLPVVGERDDRLRGRGPGLHGRHPLGWPRLGRTPGDEPVVPGVTGLRRHGARFRTCGSRLHTRGRAPEPVTGRSGEFTAGRAATGTVVPARVEVVLAGPRTRLTVRAHRRSGGGPVPPSDHAPFPGPLRTLGPGGKAVGPALALLIDHLADLLAELRADAVAEVLAELPVDLLADCLAEFLAELLTGRSVVTLPREVVPGLIRVISDGGHDGHLSFCSTDRAAMSSACGSGCTSRASSGASRRSRSASSARSR